MSHFSAIGLTGETPEGFQESVGRALERGGLADLGAASKNHFWFQDPSGAALASHLDHAGKIACVTPFFASPEGATRWRVKTSRAHVDHECAHCSGADCDVLPGPGEELVTRTAVQWVFFEPFRHWLGEAREFELELVGFASALAVGQSLDELEHVQAELFGPREPGKPPGTPMRLGAQSFLPYGMFSNEGDLGKRARAFVVGDVTAMATRTNTLTGQRFLHLTLESLGGALDVVAPFGMVELEPAPKVALADVWLVGRPTERPPESASSPGWFRKLLAR